MNGSSTNGASAKHTKMKTDLTDYATRRSKAGPYADDLDIDAIIVGGGFGEPNN
jgi:hypothetical protein